MHDLNPLSQEEKKEILEAFLPEKLVGKSEWNLEKIFRYELRRKGEPGVKGGWLDPDTIIEPWRSLAHYTTLKGEYFAEGCFWISGEKVKEYISQNGFSKLFEPTADELIGFFVWRLSEAIPAFVMLVYQRYCELLEALKIYRLAHEVIDRVKELEDCWLQAKMNLEELDRVIENSIQVCQQLSLIDSDRLVMPSLKQQESKSSIKMLEQLFDIPDHNSYYLLFGLCKDIVENIIGTDDNAEPSIVQGYEKRFSAIIDKIKNYSKLSNRPPEIAENLFVASLVTIFKSFEKLFAFEVSPEELRTQRWKFSQACFNLFLGGDDKKFYSDDTWQKKVKKISMLYENK